MQDEQLIVKYITINTCFVYLPEQWQKKVMLKSNVVKILHNKINYYFTWYTRPNCDNKKICFSATFARSLNIKEGDEVFVSCVEEAPSLTSITVIPKNFQDREIVEIQSENIQTNLLQQIKVVAQNQTIIFWVSKFLSVTLIVDSLDPQYRYGTLETLTEIYVKKTVRIIPELGNVLENRYDSLKTVTETSDVYRVHPLIKSENNKIPFLPCHAFAHLTFRDHKFTKFFKVYEVRGDRQYVNLTNFKAKGINSELITTIVCPLEDLFNHYKDINKNYYNFEKHPCIYMSVDLMDTLQIRIGAKVILEPIYNNNESYVECSSIEIYPCDKYFSEEDFYNFIRQNSKNEKMFLSHGFITFENKTRCLIKLLPNDCMYTYVDEKALKKIKIEVNEMITETIGFVDEIQDTYFLERYVAINALETVIKKCVGLLILSLGMHNITTFKYNRKNILIKGTAGSGKTTICKVLCNELNKSPYFIRTKIINCKSIKGKKVEVIQKLLTAEISYAVYYQPSILFLDNIEYITSASSNTEEHTIESMNAIRITDVLYNIISEYQTTNSILVVATCTSITKIGNKLRESQGAHFFSRILTISNPEKEERVKILRSSLQEKLQIGQDIDLNTYVNKTEGWVVQDLVNLADKAVFTAWKRHVKDQSQDQLTLKTFDLSQSLSHCKPNSLKGIELYRGSGHGWSQIGGLTEVKRALVEILYWPLKYSGIFQRAPVKLQSGVLLYGMPGTGKTLLAGSIADEYNMNMISIKGPELLSKYIGASEEAVRNLFEKAYRARPCVVFFDEFDSLAPRRGHDNTGVTDRVVNQLLTYLDGIEDREGVAVIAASSRPDLLDAALLRPGRIDKSLLCPLPNEIEREKILSALCVTHDIDIQELNLKELASLTPDFTGADLNSVLIQARLTEVEEASLISLENCRNYSSKNLTQKRLIESVNSTKPSLLRTEKEKYTRIYAKFAQSENYEISELNQKITLA